MRVKQDSSETLFWPPRCCVLSGKALTLSGPRSPKCETGDKPPSSFLPGQMKHDRPPQSQGNLWGAGRSNTTSRPSCPSPSPRHPDAVVEVAHPKIIIQESGAEIMRHSTPSEPARLTPPHLSGIRLLTSSAPRFICPRWGPPSALGDQATGAAAPGSLTSLGPRCARGPGAPWGWRTSPGWTAGGLQVRAHTPVGMRGGQQGTLRLPDPSFLLSEPPCHHGHTPDGFRLEGPLGYDAQHGASRCAL